MKLIHYLYIVPLGLLAACSSDDKLSLEETQPNGAIQLSAGRQEATATRAGAEEFHTTPGHLNLTEDTKLALRVSGIWTGHDPVEIVQPTTATVGDVTGTGNKHNALSCSPTLYWDDYGSAAEGNYDPANPTATSDGGSTTYGRGVGLTIFGVGINGKTDAAPTVGDWTSLSWTLSNNQTTSGYTPAEKDLLISNNVQAAPGASTSNDGTYKFDERESGKLLEFRHALSKVTVNLKPGDGFGGSLPAATTVTLTSNTPATSNTEWAYTQGNINVTTGEVSNQSTPSAILMNEGTVVNVLAEDGYTMAKEALVMPGSTFSADNAIIAKINAGGNIYYVTAQKIRAAIALTTDFGSSYAAKPGKNYILKIVVNKTDIQVTATVTDWVEVTADQEEPVINIDADFGSGTTAATEGFSFYRSLSLNDGYSNGSKTGDFYPSESSVSKVGATWTMTPPLYWPTHDTHYQFRGVWPATVTTAGDGVLANPRVEDATHNDANYQVIKVKNVAYAEGTFPSDLMIARPEGLENTTCSNPDHVAKNLHTVGICATEGTIKLNFRYMMSQVEVRLTTSGESASDRVRLAGAVVDLVNVYNTGDVKLGDRGVLTTGSKGNYTLDDVPSVADDPGTPEDESVDNSNKRWSAIVPQSLTYTTAQADGNLKFRITITNADTSTDVYYADVQPIPVLEKGAEGPAAPTTHWVSGKHYIYTLHLTKTEVRVSATLTDWKKVEASQNVWF